MKTLFNVLKNQLKIRLEMIALEGYEELCSKAKQSMEDYNKELSKTKEGLPAKRAKILQKRMLKACANLTDWVCKRWRNIPSKGREAALVLAQQGWIIAESGDIILKASENEIRNRKATPILRLVTKGSGGEEQQEPQES